MFRCLFSKFFFLFTSETQKRLIFISLSKILEVKVQVKGKWLCLGSGGRDSLPHSALIIHLCIFHCMWKAGISLGLDQSKHPLFYWLDSRICWVLYRKILGLIRVLIYWFPRLMLTLECRYHCQLFKLIVVPEILTHFQFSLSFWESVSFMIEIGMILVIFKAMRLPIWKD